MRQPKPKLRVLHRPPKGHRCSWLCSVHCMCGKTIHFVEVKPAPPKGEPRG